MGEPELRDFAVRSVVEGGRVVLDAPLGVSDGPYVTITRYRNGDIPELMEWKPLTEEQKQWFLEDAKWLRARVAARAAGGSALRQQQLWRRLRGVRMRMTGSGGTLPSTLSYYPGRQPTFALPNNCCGPSHSRPT
jgi:hypothetical protein